MRDQALVDLLLGIVRRRDEHRAAADALDETRNERHRADEHMRDKFAEFVATFRSGL